MQDAEPILSIDEITTFAYCSMQYHLRYRHAFPWYPTTPETAFHKAIQKALLSYFGLQLLPARRHSAMELATRNFISDMEVVQEYFPEHAGKVLKLRAEGLLSLSSSHWYFDPTRDMVIASRLPYGTTISWGKDKVHVNGKIDAVIMRDMHNPSLQSAVVLDITDAHDYINDNSILGYVKRGWARYVVREGLELGYDTPLRYQAFPVHKKDYTAKVTGVDTNSFRVAAIQASKGIESGMALPTASASKCKSCPYVKVCRPSLATTGLVEAKEIVQEAAQGSPFK